MSRHWKPNTLASISLLALLSGCTVSQVDFSNINRPARASELDAYDVFVGKWNWQAEMENATDKYKQWKGTAEWKWTLDKRSLHGTMSAKSGDKSFNSAGVWSWHPTKKKYMWWLFNDWGYPQEGTAKHYGPCEKCEGWWKMKYKSVGLDGTKSYGEYRLTVTDKDTIELAVTEWADAFHTIKKMSMTGAYTRRK